MCDRDMISSPDDTVVRSSTEDHVVESPRDRSVADHHTPDPDVGTESPVLQDRLDAEHSVQNRYLQNRNDLLVRDQPSRVRSMSSSVYNPLPFKKRFLSVPQVDLAAEPSQEIVPAPNRESIVDVSPELSGHVSPSSPRIFSPVPYSRHSYSYSPVHWQNPSVSRSPTEVETEEKETDDGQNPIAPSCIEEGPEESVCLYKEKSNDEKDIKADEVLELKSPTDNQNTTEGKSPEDEKEKDAQTPSEEPVDIEAVDGQNPKEPISSDEWLIDQHSPVDTRPLLEEWTKKRSEEYQKSLKRPLTAIPEDEAEESTNNNKGVNSSHSHTEKTAEDGVEIELANKSPLRDSLEEFIQLEKYFDEEEKRRNDQLIDMKPGEVSDGLDKTKCDEEVKKPNIVAKVMNKFKTKRQTKARKKKGAADVKENDEDSKELEDLKKAFEEQLEEKQEFEKLIEKQEKDLKGQLREMDEVMETVQSEHDNLEKATKEFADTMKVHKKYKTEVTRTRVQISQEEISLSMLQSDNSDLEKELRDVYDDIEQIKERRSVGLEGLKQKIIDAKRETETLKEENDEIEAGTKKKMTEFNELRMTVMEKGITYVKKGTIVKGASTVRFPDIAGPKSPPPKALSRRIDIDFPNIDNIPPDLKAPRVNIPDKCSVDKSSKRGSDNKIDDCGSLGKPVRQMSTLELVRIPGARDEPSKIPKPTYQLYGSSTRDSERYTVSDVDSKRMVVNKDYKRANFVKEGEKDATKFTFDFIDVAPESERVRSFYEKNKCIGDISGKTQYEFWRNYNANQDKIKNEMYRRNASEIKRSIPPLQKQAVIPKGIIKKEVKSKIDTGLKNRPFNQKRDLSANKKTVKKTNGPVRSNTEKTTKRDLSSATGKTRSLPPLKKAQNESEIPRSPSFGNKAPLPEIQPAHEPRMKKNNFSKKKVVTRTLPPIKPPNAGRLPAIQKDNKQPKLPPKRKAPEVMWISFSPTPPTDKEMPANRRSPDSGRA